MSFASTVIGLKTRFDSIAAQGQEALKAAPGTLKQANEALRSGVETLVATEARNAKEIFESARASLDKARADGIIAILSNPAGYLPPVDPVKSAVGETVCLVSKTGNEVLQAIRSGLMPEPPKPTAKSTVKAAVQPVVEVVEKTATTAKKRATKARKKVAAAVKKATD